MADKSNKDAQIRAQWAIGQAVQIAVAGDISKIKVADLKINAQHLFNLVDEIVEAGNVVEPTPASESSLKYLKSLLMKNGYGKINGKNVDDFIKHQVGTTQEEISKCIDEIKDNPSVVGEWINADHTNGWDDGEGLEPDDRDEVEPPEHEPLLDPETGKELPY